VLGRRKPQSVCRVPQSGAGLVITQWSRRCNRRTRRPLSKVKTCPALPGQPASCGRLTVIGTQLVQLAGAPKGLFCSAAGFFSDRRPSAQPPTSYLTVKWYSGWKWLWYACGHKTSCFAYSRLGGLFEARDRPLLESTSPAGTDRIVATGNQISRRFCRHR